MFHKRLRRVPDVHSVPVGVGIYVWQYRQFCKNIYVANLAVFDVFGGKGDVKVDEMLFA